MTALNKQALREAAEKALPAMQRLLVMPNDELFDDVLLNVDGDVDAANAFNLLTGPETVLALVDALEKAQKSNQFLKDQLSELANFNPDWDKLEASYESWREIAAELLVAKDRIAELESRIVTVKLPAACADDEYFNDGVFQPMRYERDVERALRAAGIQVIEGEGQ